ncbi:unnamed protein product [Microthlaspi erraticum]|uniref:Uncharacterized protein n=1 Tax=Microthlaspi erraticum TaxID=1685480 RepID=A0A6D2JC77_9BRAS|nr:unnamed protein product [Microthlaspi erraticum]
MKKANVYLLLSILLITSSPLSSVSQLLPYPSLGTIFIRGVLLCSLEGDPNAPPVSGASVYLFCNGQNVTGAQAVTDLNGTFAIALEIIQTVLFSLNNMSCRVVANLPAGNCGIFPPNGIVTASIMLLNVTSTSVGNIIFFTAGPFVGGVL